MSTDQLAKLVQSLITSKTASAKKRDPKTIYAKLIDDRLARYNKLRDAVAGLLFMRNKLEGEIHERRAEVARAYDEAKRAARRGDDELALSLITHKHGLMEGLGRADEDLKKVRIEAQGAKRNLLKFREEIRELEREQAESLSTLSAAEAHKKLKEAVDQSASVRENEALERAREHVARVQAEHALDQELECFDPWDDPSIEEAKLELMRLKNRMRLRLSMATA